MKKNIFLNKLTATLLAAALTVSMASCSSDNNENEETETTTTVEETTAEETTATETSEETSEETTTAEETTEAPAEETTDATAEETVITTQDDPDTAMYTDPEVRNRARWYIDNGYYVEYMDHDNGESWWGEGTNLVEGFGAAEDDDSFLTIDYVMKFPDYETANAFLDRLDGSDFGNVVRTEHGDGSCDIEVGGGVFTGYLSTNYVIELVFHPEAVQ